jgi:hypothetical protein
LILIRELVRISAKDTVTTELKIMLNISGAWNQQFKITIYKEWKKRE